MPMLPLVLVITADRAISESLRDEIGAGFKAYYVESHSSALGVLGQWRFDAILCHARGFGDALNPMLGELQAGVATPILLLVDDGACEDRQLQALEAGASQLVVGAASARVVAAQLRRLIDVSQRRLEQHSTEMRFGPLRLDPRQATASIDGSSVPLTAGEFELLLLLASPPGELVHRHTLARTIGQVQGVSASRSVDMHVCRIRRKLKDAGGHNLHVETVYGRGYRLKLGHGPAAADASRRAVEWSV